MVHDDIDRSDTLRWGCKLNPDHSHMSWGIALDHTQQVERKNG